jgi:hypothetical protein
MNMKKSFICLVVLGLSVLGLKASAAKLFNQHVGSEFKTLQPGDLLAGNGMSGGGPGGARRSRS